MADASAAGAAELAREAAELPAGCPRLLVWNKADLEAAPPAPPAPSASSVPPGTEWVAVSARTGSGLAELADRAAALLGMQGVEAPLPGEGAGLARALSARHRTALGEALGRLDEAGAMLAAGQPLDLVAAALRLASDALDGVTGRTTSEDVLDRIFSRFCIGK